MLLFGGPERLVSVENYQWVDDTEIQSYTCTVGTFHGSEFLFNDTERFRTKA